jgi:type IV fimbrial biogenesis protein FimT
MDRTFHQLLGHEEERVLIMDARRMPGFTIIELMIGIALVGLLVMIGLPNFTAWMQNTQIRNAAESILNGIQVARTEAVRRNRAVRLDLTTPGTSDWQVRINTPPALVGAPLEPDPVQARVGKEGSATAAVASGGANTITFNGVGWVIPNADGTNSITRVDVTAGPTVSSGVVTRRLSIIVGTNGTVRMCDPDPNLLTASPPDPRAC